MHLHQCNGLFEMDWALIAGNWIHRRRLFTDPTLHSLSDSIFSLSDLFFSKSQFLNIQLSLENEDSPVNAEAFSSLCIKPYMHMPSVQPFSTSVGVITVSRAGNFIRPTCAKLPPQSAFFFSGNRILNQSSELVTQGQSFWHHYSGCIHYPQFSLHTTRRRYRWVESGKPQ